MVPMGLAVRGRGVPEPKRVWSPIWYKPWTWLHFETIFIVKNFDLFEVSIVKEPADPTCVITR